MKMYLVFVLVSLVAVGCQQKLSVGDAAPADTIASSDSPADEEVSEVSFNVSNAPTVAFLVPDMMCEFSCVEAVKKTLSKQPGVKEVKIDFDTKQATLVVDNATFDAKAAVEELIDRQFFNAKLISASER